MASGLTIDDGMDVFMPAKSWHLLHLEDNDLDAELIAARLARSEMDILIDRVAHRDQYQEKLQAQPYSLIISDYQVPSFTGLDALAMAKQYQPSVPFIFVSGQIGEEFAVETLRQGSTDYILKERLTRLPAAIARAINEAEQRLGRIAAETASKEVQQRLQFAYEAAKLGAWEYDLATGDMLLSPTCLENLGLPLDNPRITHESLLAYIHPDDRDRVIQKLRHSIETCGDYDVAYRVNFPDGTSHWLNVRGRILPDERGATSRMMGACVDISLQKEAEQQLSKLAAHERHRAEIFDRLASSSRTLNSVLSRESILGILAQEARSILNCGLATATALNPVDPNNPLRIISDARTDHQPVGSVAVKPIDGTTSVQSSRSVLEIPLLGHSGNYLGWLRLEQKASGEFTKEDESVLSQLAAIAAVSLENARLYETLRDQDRRKDEFLATLSHELRNPLAPIRNGMAILQQMSSDAPREILEMMDRQLNQMVRLVDDLLDVSRVTSGKFRLQLQLVELQQIIASSIETSRPIIDGGRHQLEVSVPDQPLMLYADPTRLAQIITNLLNNAAKYTPAGGEISLLARLDEDQIVVEVLDTGIGIPREMLTRVFDIFTQVGSARERSQGGLGIGLTLVRRLIELHGGTVYADSDGMGKGSKFALRLPHYTGRAPLSVDEAPTIHEVPMQPLPSRQILVVDDNVDGAESLAEMLRLNGHEVQTAHSGPEAIAIVAQMVPDVTFLDIGLPGMNGYEVARQFRNDPRLKSVVLIAVTGWGSDEDRRHARESGFDYHFTKPAEQRALTRILAQISPPPKLRPNE